MQRWLCPHSFSFYLGILSQLFLREPQCSPLERENGGVCLVGIKEMNAEKKFSAVCPGGCFLLVSHVSGSACVNSLFGWCQASSLHLRSNEPLSTEAQSAFGWVNKRSRANKSFLHPQDWSRHFAKLQRSAGPCVALSAH